MKPYLLLAVIGLAGCAFGQIGTTSSTDPYVICADNNMRQVPCGTPAPKKPVRRKPRNITDNPTLVNHSGLPPEKPAKPPFQCDHSKPQSCASQANDDYGPGRSGLVGEIPPEFVGAVPSCQGGVVPYRSDGIWICDPSGPIDVPAIQETALGDNPVVLADPSNCVDGAIQNALYGNRCATRKYWTCADPSRFLLTSVDGKKRICHREQL